MLGRILPYYSCETGDGTGDLSVWFLVFTDFGLSLSTCLDRCVKTTAPMKTTFQLPSFTPLLNRCPIFLLTPFPPCVFFSLFRSANFMQIEGLSFAVTLQQCPFLSSLYLSSFLLFSPRSPFVFCSQFMDTVLHTIEAAGDFLSSALISFLARHLFPTRRLVLTSIKSWARICCFSIFDNASFCSGDHH